jgi:pilus assembly protein TadC
MAHIHDHPTDFVKKTFKGAITFSLGLSVFAFFMLDMLEKPVALIIVICPVLFLLLFLLIIKRPITKISKRKRDLEREVLFAGRFLLVKIHSGRPLLNALVDASQSYGISSKYFKELVDDVNMGTPIEKALDNAMKYSPSDKFRKILFQISNSIKIGIDVSDPLTNTLDEISQQQLIEIQRYGKKLNSLSIFYMLLAVVMPSIGVAMFAVIGSLIGLGGDTASKIFYAILGFLCIVQIIFVSIFKAARLSVNL